MDDMILIHEKDGKITHVNGEIITDIPSSSGQKKLNSQKIKSIIIADLNPQGKIKISDAEVVITKVNKARRRLYFILLK
jgi:hypothetical protein